VNIEWISTRHARLDLSSSLPIDFHLVFTGPRALSLSLEGVARTVRIDGCHLFDTRELLTRQPARRAKSGDAVTVSAEEWNAAEIFPGNHNPLLEVDPQAQRLLDLFGG
jgi:hypothetical protein